MASGLLLTLLLTVLSLGSVINESHKNENNLTAPLRFTSAGTFQISVFEDLHFGENAWDQWGPQQDYWSTVVMNEILNHETQQLVVLNGDLITGENTYLENSTDYLDIIVAPLVERGLNWASTYGNHDHEYNLSSSNVLEREQSYPNSRTAQMVFGAESGVSNYYIPVYSSDESKDVPCLILWFFDSRGGHYFQQIDSSGNVIAQPDWVDESVVEWFLQTNEELIRTHGGVIPSLAFVHIPTNASRAAQTEAGIKPHYQPGINADYPLAQQGQGWCSDGSEGCDYGRQDVPFMNAIASTQGLIALFSGHDHGDTWCYKWDRPLLDFTAKASGLNLCFGQHSGYGGYGSWTRGSRQILISESKLADLEIETWIRLETSEVVGSVTLNSTYNSDWYPATKDTHTHCPTCVYTNITSD